jgi:hypothetical protein
MITKESVVGTISALAFESGDQFVVGCWKQTPVGPFSDVMWLDADNNRTLLASSGEAADYITTIYEFDRVEVVEFAANAGRRTTAVVAGDLELRLQGGVRRPVPIRRPRLLTQLIEAPIARRLMGVEVYGTSPTGAREWYQSTGWSWVKGGSGRHRGHDLGSMVELDRPMGVGFSNPPPRPAIVSVRVAIRR